MNKIEFSLSWTKLIRTLASLLSQSLFAAVGKLLCCVQQFEGSSFSSHCLLSECCRTLWPWQLPVHNCHSPLWQLTQSSWPGCNPHPTPTLTLSLSASLDLIWRCQRIAMSWMWQSHRAQNSHRPQGTHASHLTCPLSACHPSQETGAEGPAAAAGPATRTPENI